MKTFLISVYNWNDLSERSWLERIGIPPPQQTLEDGVMILLSTPAPQKEVDAVLDSVKRGTLKRYSVFHVGDEFLGKVQGCNGRQLYAAAHTVFRNYHDPSLQNVQTLPLGPMTFSLLPYEQDRVYSWSFAGDVAKACRKQIIEIFSDIVPNKVQMIHAWKGPGSLQSEEYVDVMRKSYFVLCPPGNFNQETFRLYEALDAGAIPVVLKSTREQNYDYWSTVLGDNASESLVVAKNWVEAKMKVLALLEDEQALRERQENCRILYLDVQTSIQTKLATYTITKQAIQENVLLV